MALARPGCEHEQDAGARVGRDRPPLVGVEREEGAGPALDRLAARFNAYRAVDDGDERAFLHLVVAQRLTRLEDDQDGACSLVRAEHDGRATAAGRLDLVEIPALHGAILNARTLGGPAGDRR